MEAEEESKLNEQSDQNLQVNHDQFAKENPIQKKVSDNNCFAQFTDEECIQVPLIVTPTENSEGNNNENNFLSQEGTDKAFNKSSKDVTLPDLTSNVNITTDTDNNYADCSRRNSSQDNKDNKQINTLSSVNADLKQLGLDSVKPVSNLTAVNDLSPRPLNTKNDVSKLTIRRSQSLTFNFKRNRNSSDDTSDYFKTSNESRLRKVFSADSQPKLATDIEKANYIKGNGSFLQKLTIRNKKISNSELNNFSEQSQIKNINSNNVDSELNERINLKLNVDNENQNLIKCNNLTPQEPVSYRLAPLLNSQHFQGDNSISKKKSAEKTLKKLEDKLHNGESSKESLTRLHRNYESRKISDDRTASLEKICKLPLLKSTSYHDIDCGKVTTSRPLILPPLGISTNDNVLKQYLKRKKNWSPSAELDTTFKVPISAKLKSTSALPLIKTTDARSRFL